MALGTFPDLHAARCQRYFFIDIRWVFSLFAVWSVIANADREFYKTSSEKSSLSMQLTRDGHFQVAAQDEEHHEARGDTRPQPPTAAPEDEKANSVLPGDSKPRRIQALVAMEPLSVQVAPRLVAVREVPDPAASSFANRTVDWLTLSHDAAGSLASSRFKARGRYSQPAGKGKQPPPTVPPERYSQKPKSWPMRAWNEYQRAYEKLAPLRGGAGNVIATGLATILGPESCILKILYVFFHMEGEDDYPYVPRGCGDMFDFALNANGIPVPWMLIAGILFLVTGDRKSVV